VQGIEQNVKDEKKRSVYFSNRAAVNLQLENYGRVITDCDEAIKLDSNNTKAYFRATKAAYGLRKYEDAVKYCEEGLITKPDDKTLAREKAKAENQVKAQKEAMEKQKTALDEEEQKKKFFFNTLTNEGLF